MHVKQGEMETGCMLAYALLGLQHQWLLHSIELPPKVLKRWQNLACIQLTVQFNAKMSSALISSAFKMV